MTTMGSFRSPAARRSSWLNPSAPLKTTGDLLIRYLPCASTATPICSVRSGALDASAVRDLDELDRLQFHVHQHGVDLGAEMPVENHARDCDNQTKRRIVEGDRDAMRQHQRGGALGRLR